VDTTVPLSDIAFYASYAERIVAGQMPYRDFLVEYPPLALPLFALPALVSTTRRVYIALFVVEMLAFNALTLALVSQWVARSEGPQRVPSRLVWYSVFLFCLSPLFVGRFDAAPMALGFAAACAWFSERPILGALLAAFGTLVKLAPGAVAVPGLLLGFTRRVPHAGRAAFAFAGTVAGGTALWASVGGDGMVESLRYHAERGLEVGSLYSGLLAAWAKVRGSEMELIFDHFSLRLAVPGAAALARYVVAIQAAALLLVVIRFIQTGMRAPMRYAAAATVAFAATGKVLSPQYLLWILPFVVALGGRTGRQARWVFLGACVATMVLCPWGFQALRELAPAMLVVLNLRNLLLLALLALLLAGPTEAEPAPAGIA
jgi:hypothetical protein